MRVFKAAAKDSKTGYAMVLSECSYNMAMDWLSRELDKCGREVYKAEYIPLTPFTRILTRGLTSEEMFTRTFYYDESRGYLLGEE